MHVVIPTHQSGEQHLNSFYIKTFKALFFLILGLQIFFFFKILRSEEGKK